MFKKYDERYNLQKKDIKDIGNNKMWYIASLDGNPFEKNPIPFFKSLSIQTKINSNSNDFFSNIQIGISRFIFP